ncbi:hypothetical protein ACJX0J_040352, partial [Zea mays]
REATKMAHFIFPFTESTSAPHATVEENLNSSIILVITYIFHQKNIIGPKIGKTFRKGLSDLAKSPTARILAD